LLFGVLSSRAQRVAFAMMTLSLDDIEWSRSTETRMTVTEYM